MIREDTLGAIMDMDSVIADVASAVRLAEGPSGVSDVLHAITRNEPVAVRDVSRVTELPVPIVAAICNELRRRGVVDRARPVRLTAAARELLGLGHPDISATCACCRGAGVALPHAGDNSNRLGGRPGDGSNERGPGDPDNSKEPTAEGSTGEGSLASALAGLGGVLERAADGAPGAKPELDQTHCTVSTKIRRVLRMHEAGALAGRRILLLGDDDLISVAIAAFAAALGAPVGRLTVIDTDPDVLAWVGQQIEGTGIRAQLVEHDLRQPLPDSLAGEFDVACTDPPYTVAGAELFLSRAVQGLADGPGRHVFFSFGARRPEETLRTQEMLGSMGLTIRGLWPGFNEYLGAGILAGSSHLYHLRSTAETRPLTEGSYSGPLYTAQTRGAVTRPYRCAGCRAVHQVGPGAQWPRIAALQAAGCPQCGGTTFRPMPLQPPPPQSAAEQSEAQQPSAPQS
jgi:N4-bis(aminopropyl)spermidine synthase